MIHLHPGDYLVMPWKAGGGVTTELAIAPHGATLADPFLWRLSSARVEASGPFSRFPGHQRELALLDGGGFDLDVGGRWLRLEEFTAPVRFSGDEMTTATLLRGPSVDLGLIWDPARIRAELATHRLETEPLPVAPAPTTLLVAPRGGIRVEPQGPALAAMDTLRFDGAESGSPLVLYPESPGNQAPLVVIRIWPLA